MDFKKEWPVLAAVGVGGLGLLMLATGGGGGGGGGASGPSQAVLNAQTQDNALGAQLQEAQDQLSASESAASQQEGGNILDSVVALVGGLMGNKYNLQTTRMDNQAANTQARLADRYSLLQTKSDNATTLSQQRLSNAGNNNTIIANLEQELQAAETQAQEEALYLEETLSGGMGAIALNPFSLGTSFPQITFGGQVPTVPGGGFPFAL